MATLKIGEMDYKNNTKPVLLDGVPVFYLDFTTYMGHRRSQDKELAACLSEKLGYTITPKDVSTALMLEYIADKKDA
jgi:hypothetical protein